MCRLLILSFVILLLSACGGTTPDPTAVAQAVEATLAAQAPAPTPIPTEALAHTNTPTLWPTDTATSTDTPVPTVTPTDTPAHTATPTDTPQPTDTPRPTATPTPQPEPIILTGSGDGVAELDKWDGPAIAQISYSGGGHFAVWNYGIGGERIDLLVNTIGRYAGTCPIDFFDDEQTVRFSIEASGGWQIKVLPFSHIRPVMVPSIFVGRGDDVVLLAGGTPDLLKVDASAARSNFVIWAYGRTRDLLVNDIAPYTGVVIAGDAALILVIEAEGDWSIEVTTPGGEAGQAVATATVSSASTKPETIGELAPKVKKAANLRSGPGTDYAIVGSAKAGDTLELLGRNEAGDWLHVKASVGEAWIADFLVENADVANLPVQTSTAPTVTPLPQQATVPEALPKIGEEVKNRGWRFKVLEVHKRKAVYFYSSSYIAHGQFLVVVIDAVNEQSGTDYFANNIDIWVTDVYGNTYQRSSKASSYAEWQYGGLSSIYTDVNPGNLARIAVAFDLPESTEYVLLSTDGPVWIDLGDFRAMPLEE